MKNILRFLKIEIIFSQILDFNSNEFLFYKLKIDILEKNISGVATVQEIWIK